MVWLKDDHIVEFPNFEFFLHGLSSRVQDEQKVFDAFLKWSTLDVSAAVECLSFSTNPLILVPKSITGPHSYGEFECAQPNLIEVRRDKVQEFDKGRDEAKIYRDGKYLEMLILHELVHWGRHWMSREDYEDDPDSGRRFAIEAYADYTHPHIK